MKRNLSRSFCPIIVYLWPLCCLSIDFRLLITPLVSSNFS